MIEVRGGPEQMAQISRACRQASRDLQREMSKALNGATKPLKADVAQSANDVLPERGGLARDVAQARITTRRLKNGVRLVARSRWSLYHLNKGIIRHPVKGGSPTIQRTTPGYWDRPLEAATPEVRRAVEDAVRQIMAKIDRAGA